MKSSTSNRFFPASEPKNKHELDESQLITAYMQYKATTIRDNGKRSPYAPFLQRNLIYVQMNQLANREKIEHFIDQHDKYPSFWVRPKKKPTLKKRPLGELIEFLKSREAFNNDLQKITGLIRSFSIAEMADYSWKIKKNLGIRNSDYQPRNDHILALDYKPVPSAAKKCKPIQPPIHRIPLPNKLFKKNALFPSEIKYRVCLVSESGENMSRIAILNGLSCFRSDEKVLCCIFCEKKFETLFHLLFHCNMCYPKLQFIPVVYGKSKKAVIDIVNNRKYQDIDEVTVKKYAGNMAAYLVFPGDRRRNNRIIPMNPTLPFENFSTFKYVFEDDVYKSNNIHPLNRFYADGYSINHVANIAHIDLLISLKRRVIFHSTNISYLHKVFDFTWESLGETIGIHRFGILKIFRFTRMYIHIHREMIERYGERFRHIVKQRVLTLGLVPETFSIAPVVEGADELQLMWLRKDLIQRLYDPTYGPITHQQSVPMSLLKCEVFKQRELYKRKCRNYPKTYCDQQFNRLAKLTDEQVDQVIAEKRWPEILPVALKLGLFPHNHYIHMLLEEPTGGFEKFKILAPTNIMKIPEYPENQG